MIAQIMKILQKISFGTATVEIALLLRESIFLNGMLTNAEIWHNFTVSEMEELEKIDRLFLSKILRVPLTIPKPAFYLELGVLPVFVLIKRRRLNYLHTILTNPHNSMLYKVFLVSGTIRVRGTGHYK